MEEKGANARQKTKDNIRVACHSSAIRFALYPCFFNRLSAKIPSRTRAKFQGFVRVFVSCWICKSYRANYKMVQRKTPPFLCSIHADFQQVINGLSKTGMSARTYCGFTAGTHPAFPKPTASPGRKDRLSVKGPQSPRGRYNKTYKTDIPQIHSVFECPWRRASHLHTSPSRRTGGGCDDRRNRELSSRLG